MWGAIPVASDCGHVPLCLQLSPHSVLYVGIKIWRQTINNCCFSYVKIFCVQAAGGVVMAHKPISLTSSACSPMSVARSVWMSCSPRISLETREKVSSGLKWLLPEKGPWLERCMSQCLPFKFHQLHMFCLPLFQVACQHGLSLAGCGCVVSCPLSHLIWTSTEESILQYTPYY